MANSGGKRPSADPIRPAADESDIPRFLKDVSRHYDVAEIQYRIAGLRAEVLARGGTSVSQWSNLRYSGHPVEQADRALLHNQILEKLLLPAARAVDGENVAIIIIGPPGAGKTSRIVPLAATKFSTSFSGVNPDDVKALLPEYEGWNAEPLHDESADLAESRIEKQAALRRLNVVYDITGRTSEKVEKSVEAFRSYGYRVYLLLADLPPWKAANRAWERFQSNPFRRDKTLEPGRFVPPEYVYREVGDRPLKTFNKLKNHTDIAGYCHYNVDVALNKVPKIIDKRGW